MGKQLRFRDGALGYILNVDADFVDADIEAVGGSVTSKWLDAGLAFVKSSDPNFIKTVRKARISTVNEIISDFGSVTDQPTPFERFSSKLPSGAKVMLPDGGWGSNKPDQDYSAFAENYQWPLVLLGMVDLKAPGENGGLYAGSSTPLRYDCPEWAANYAAGDPLEGSGIKIGLVAHTPSCVVQNALTPDNPFDFEIDLHPEFMLYKSSLVTDPLTLDSVIPESVFEEDPAAGELDPHGGVLGYSVINSMLYDKGAWSNDVSYNQFDRVSYDGGYYMAIWHIPAGGGIPPYADGDTTDGWTAQVGPSPTQRELLTFPNIYSGTQGRGAEASVDGFYDTAFSGMLCARGVGLVTDDQGVAVAAGSGQPVPGSQLPEMDGVSRIAAIDAQHEALGPYTDVQYKGVWDVGKAYTRLSVVKHGTGYYQASGPIVAGLDNPSLNTAGWDVLPASTAAGMMRVRGRMRGIAPRATVIHYTDFFPIWDQDPVHQFFYGSTFAQLIRKAIDHKLNILVVPGIPASLSIEEDHIYQSFMKEPLRLLRQTGCLVVTGNVNAIDNPAFIDPAMYVPKSRRGLHNMLTGSMASNTLICNGVGPRVYDFADPDLSDYVPNPETYPQQKDKNLARIAQSQITIGFGPGFFAGIAFIGQGGDVGKAYDVAAPMGSNDIAYAKGTPLVEFAQYPMAAQGLVNGFIYTTVSRDGSLSGSWAATMVGNPNVGRHGGDAWGRAPAVHTAGLAALLLEYQIRKTGRPTNPGKWVVQLIQKSALDRIGPTTDDLILSFRESDKAVMNLMAKNEGYPITYFSPTEMPDDPRQGIGEFGFGPWVEVIPVTLFAPVPMVTAYFPSYPGDAPGEDEIYGRGVVNFTSAKAEIDG